MAVPTSYLPRTFIFLAHPAMLPRRRPPKDASSSTQPPQDVIDNADALIDDLLTNILGAKPTPAQQAAINDLIDRIRRLPQQTDDTRVQFGADILADLRSLLEEQQANTAAVAAQLEQLHAMQPAQANPVGRIIKCIIEAALTPLLQPGGVIVVLRPLHQASFPRKASGVEMMLRTLIPAIDERGVRLSRFLYVAQLVITKLSHRITLYSQPVMFADAKSKGARLRQTSELGHFDTLVNWSRFPADDAKLSLGLFVTWVNNPTFRTKDDLESAGLTLHAYIVLKIHLLSRRAKPTFVFTDVNMLDRDGQSLAEVTGNHHMRSLFHSECSQSPLYINLSREETNTCGDCHALTLELTEMCMEGVKFTRDEVGDVQAMKGFRRIARL
ncbi:hypothetical protein DFH06DRAFT_1382649 [Mycena polygramma]|nr:hypothetical protein DFH06DRAFT_1382649 [Mycena polygramma]